MRITAIFLIATLVSNATWAGGSPSHSNVCAAMLAALRAARHDSDNPSLDTWYAIHSLRKFPRYLPQKVLNAHGLDEVNLISRRIGLVPENYKEQTTFGTVLKGPEVTEFIDDLVTAANDAQRGVEENERGPTDFWMSKLSSAVTSLISYAIICLVVYSYHHGSQLHPASLALLAGVGIGMGPDNLPRLMSMSDWSFKGRIQRLRKFIENPTYEGDFLYDFGEAKLLPQMFMRATEKGEFIDHEIALAQARRDIAIPLERFVDRRNRPLNVLWDLLLTKSKNNAEPVLVIVAHKI